MILPALCLSVFELLFLVILSSPAMVLSWQNHVVIYDCGPSVIWVLSVTLAAHHVLHFWLTAFYITPSYISLWSSGVCNPLGLPPLCCCPSLQIPSLLFTEHPWSITITPLLSSSFLLHRSCVRLHPWLNLTLHLLCTSPHAEEWGWRKTQA